MSSSSKISVLETLADLVRINSVNPEWGGPGEGAVADYVTRFFERAGIGVEREEVLPGRPNVVARLPGVDRRRSILLEAHMDTVGVAGMTIDPFEPRIADGRLWGRGSCDIKAGLAAMMHTLAGLKAADVVPPIDIVLAAVVDEEHEFRGVTALLESFDVMPDAAVVAEPTRMEIARANKGVLRWRIIAHGKSAHSSKPELGADAITAMADVVRAFADDAARLAESTHPLLGAATCNIGRIDGGDQVNFVPAHCAISIDRRLLPGESIEDVLAAYEVLLESVREGHPKIRFESEAPTLADAAMETAADEAIVLAAGMIADKTGLSSRPIGVPFGCDCTKLSRAGIPSIIFGPGSIDQAHTADEYVPIQEVEFALDFYQAVALEYGTS
jgi:acetylornithine deacetylase/succinyl-diaminopimelate desuccinylase family protein